MDDRFELHNVAETPAVEGGVGLHRLPADLRAELNEKAEDNYRRPSGVEVRFVPDGEAEVTVSCAEGELEVTPFWGPFEAAPGAHRRVGSDPETVELSPPERVLAVEDDHYDTNYFDPQVCRLVLRGNPSVLHGVEGDVRPPREAELPEQTLLAYGTSITQGGVATRHPLTYASQAARLLGTDLLNLGTGGSAFCERAIADHIAAREDWDAAVLAVSVNMIAVGFDAEEFYERAAYLVDTVAGENPGKPVAAVTLFPVFPELGASMADTDWEATVPEYREALRAAVADAGHDNLHLVEGPDLLPPTGLSPDLLHPTDHGMIRAGEALADRLDPLL